MQLEIKQYENLKENQKNKIEQIVENVHDYKNIDEKGTLHLNILDLGVTEINSILVDILIITNS